MADQVSSPTALPSLGLTIGAAYLGLVAAAILFGITNVQVYVYYITYPKDWVLQKIAVAVLWILDGFHLALTIHVVYHYLVESFGNYLALDELVWSFKLQIAINIIIIVLVQTLYALRVWRLGSQSNPILAWVVVITVAAGYAVGIILAVKTYGIRSFSSIGTIAWAVYTSFAASTFVDFVIAVVMLFYLQKSRSEFAGTNSKIVAIMRYVLASGLATSVCSMTALITYGAMPDNLVFLGIEFLLTKLYINSFVAMLNARQSIREKSTVSTHSISITRMMHIRTDPPSSQVQPSTHDKGEYMLSPIERSMNNIKMHEISRPKRSGIKPDSTFGTSDEIEFKEIKSADSNIV